MVSYSVLPPNKKGQQRIKLFVEYGYDDNGKRLRKMKTVTLDKLTENNIHLLRLHNHN